MQQFFQIIECDEPGCQHSERIKGFDRRDALRQATGWLFLRCDSWPRAVCLCPQHARVLDERFGTVDHMPDDLVEAAARRRQQDEEIRDALRLVGDKLRGAPAA